jgi:hypothetical protein
LKLIEKEKLVLMKQETKKEKQRNKPMEPMYDIFKKEPDDQFLTVVFAFDEEVDRGIVSKIRHIPSDIREELRDKSESDEDYVNRIMLEKPYVIRTKLEESEADVILKKFGYIRNNEIRNLAWK